MRKARDLPDLHTAGRWAADCEEQAGHGAWTWTSSAHGGKPGRRRLATADREDGSTHPWRVPTREARTQTGSPQRRPRGAPEAGIAGARDEGGSCSTRGRWPHPATPRGQRARPEDRAPCLEPRWPAPDASPRRERGRNVRAAKAAPTAPSEGVTAEASGPGRPQTEGRAGDVHAERGDSPHALTLRRMTLQANADDANAKPFHA